MSMEGLPIMVCFKEIFDQVRKVWILIVHSELKRHNVSHYIYYLATDNIHIVLENDNTVLIKGLKKFVNVKFSRNTHLIETSYDRLKSREITFQQYRENLAKAGVFRWVTNIHEHKDITIPLIIHYYLLRAFRTLHKSFHALNHNVRFLPCQHRGVGTVQYVYALNPVCIVLIIGYSAEKFPSWCDFRSSEPAADSSHLTYINKY